MQWLIGIISKQKLAVSMLVGFAVPLALFACFAVTSYLATAQIGDDASTLRDESAFLAGVGRSMKLDTVQVQQWLTDISATRGLDGLNDGFDEAKAARVRFLAGIEEFRTIYKRDNDSKGLKQLETLEQAMVGYYASGVEMAEAYVRGGPAEGNHFMAAFDTAAEDLQGALEPFVLKQTAELDRRATAIVDETRQLAKLIVLVALISLLMGTGLAVVLTRGVASPLGQCVKSLEALAEQDFSQSLSFSGDNEMGRIAGAVNRCTEATRKAFA